LIGTSDLTAEMGISGEIAHQRVVAAYAEVGEACRRNGKFLGMGGVYDEENATRYIGTGAQFILSGADHLYLMTGGAARTTFLRGIARRGDTGTTEGSGGEGI